MSTQPYIVISDDAGNSVKIDWLGNVSVLTGIASFTATTSETALSCFGTIGVFTCTNIELLLINHFPSPFMALNIGEIDSTDVGVIIVIGSAANINASGAPTAIQLDWGYFIGDGSENFSAYYYVGENNVAYSDPGYSPTLDAEFVNQGSEGNESTNGSVSIASKVISYTIKNVFDFTDAASVTGANDVNFSSVNLGSSYLDPSACRFVILPFKMTDKFTT